MRNVGADLREANICPSRQRTDNPSGRVVQGLISNWSRSGNNSGLEATRTQSSYGYVEHYNLGYIPYKVALRVRVLGRDFSRRQELHANRGTDFSQGKNGSRKNPQTLSTNHPGSHRRNHNFRLPGVQFLPQEHNQTPNTHIYGKVPSNEKRHRHRHGERHKLLNPRRRKIFNKINKNRKPEKPITELQTVTRQSREPFHAKNRHVSIDKRIRRLKLSGGVADIKRRVKQKKTERRHDTANHGPDSLAKKHSPRRSHTGEPRHDAVLFSGHRRHHEQPQFAVVVGHVYVGQTCAIGVAEGQRGSDHVGEDYPVPFHLGKDHRNSDHRNDR
nr:hypothetical protein TorRG33x02_114080 [Ipomoea batatas]